MTPPNIVSEPPVTKPRGSNSAASSSATSSKTAPDASAPATTQSSATQQAQQQQPSLKIWLDGHLVDKADAKVSVYDHGLLYGDGVFEGIRAYSGRVFRLERHVDRLYESARSIHLQVPMARDEMARAITDT